jgi:hypothetical protein
VGFLQRLFKGEQKETSAVSRGSSKEDALAAYIVREHRLGRSIEGILDDPYLKNRASEEQRRRLLDRPEVIHAIGEDTAAMARERIS